MFEVALNDIVAQLGGELIGDGSRRIDRIGPLDSATPSTLAFLSNPAYQAQLAMSRAGCVIVGPRMRDAAVARGAAIVAADPYLYFAKLTQWWAAAIRLPAPVEVHASALIDVSARLGENVTVGPFAVIGARAEIGAGAVIGAHDVVGDDARIGAGSRLAPHVTIGERCVVGERAIVHSGAVVGSDGFGFAPNEGRWEKIEQLGAVVIGDDVEIGANTCIDRGALDDTVIGNGVKLDNQIQIAHNVRIGEHTAIAGCVGIAGSTVVGSHCTIGGGSGLAGHLTIADHVHISGASAVTHSIRSPGTYSGLFPMDDHASWEKNAAALRRLHGLRSRVMALEKKMPEPNP